MARANPVNFVDPSGRDAASEYSFFSLNTVAKGVVLTATGEAVGCAFYSLASATDLVGQHIGQQITQLSLLWQGCAASITTSQYLNAFAANTALLGLGEGVGWAIGDLMEGAEQGAVQPWLAAETAATPFQQIMSKLQGMDFSSAPNTAVFYSGAGTGQVAATLAEQGLTTISSTEGGAYLESLGDLYGPTSPVSRGEADQLWTNASAQYANGASGDVLAILNNPNPARIYLSTEQPILLNNPNITSLTETSIPDLFIISGNFH